jgi:hypothetical protein
MIGLPAYAPAVVTLIALLGGCTGGPAGWRDPALERAGDGTVLRREVGSITGGDDAIVVHWPRPSIPALGSEPRRPPEGHTREMVLSIRIQGAEEHLALSEGAAAVVIEIGFGPDGWVPAPPGEGCSGAEAVWRAADEPVLAPGPTGWF